MGFRGLRTRNLGFLGFQGPSWTLFPIWGKALGLRVWDLFRCFPPLSYLNSLKGDYIGNYYKGGTRSVEYSSFGGKLRAQGLGFGI